MLNLTTNTLHSVYNTSVSANSVMPLYGNKRAHVEQCARIERAQIEMGPVVVEGGFAQVFRGQMRRERADAAVDDAAGRDG